MRIERDASNSFTLAARPTVTPSRWLLRFNRADDAAVEQLCIATAYAETGMPVLLTFTEVDSTPDAQAGEVTLNPGQWRLRAYEQTTTSLNYANSDRLAYDVLVEVVGAEAPDPEPTDPCEGGGDCDPTTVNGVESDTPTITVVQGGVEVGEFNPATGVVKIDECPPSGDVRIRNANDTQTLATVTAPDDYVIPAIRIPYVDADGAPQYFPGYVAGITAGELTLVQPGGGPPPVPRFRVRTTDTATVVGYRDLTSPTLDLPQSVIKYRDAANALQVTDPSDTEFAGGTLRAAKEVPRREMKNSAAAGLGIYATLDRLIADTIPSCPDATIQRKDSAAVDIGSPIAAPSGATTNVTCPDGTVNVRNLNGTTLGSPTVKSNGSTNYDAPIPFKLVWDAGDADTTIWTVTDDEAGTYGTYTQTGTNGTVTYSKNGGGYAALSGSISLAIGDTITVRRTTTTNAGSTRWVP